MAKKYFMRVTADFVFDIDIVAESEQEAIEIAKNKAYDTEDYNQWTFDGIVDAGVLLSEDILTD